MDEEKTYKDVKAEYKRRREAFERGEVTEEYVAKIEREYRNMEPESIEDQVSDIDTKKVPSNRSIADGGAIGVIVGLLVSLPIVAFVEYNDTWSDLSMTGFCSGMVVLSGVCIGLCLGVIAPIAYVRMRG